MRARAVSLNALMRFIHGDEFGFKSSSKGRQRLLKKQALRYNEDAIATPADKEVEEALQQKTSQDGHGACYALFYTGQYSEIQWQQLKQ
jgi:hypothetical protein